MYPAGQKSDFSQTLALIFFRPALLSGAVRQKELVSLCCCSDANTPAARVDWTFLAVVSAQCAKQQEENNAGANFTYLWMRTSSEASQSASPVSSTQVCFQSDCLLSLDCYLRNQITAEGYQSNWVTKRRMLEKITHQKTSGELRKFRSYFY